MVRLRGAPYGSEHCFPGRTAGERVSDCGEKRGVGAFGARPCQRHGVSVGTVYRHFSAKDELTTATIQLYFKHAFYERFCHIDPQVGFVDYCREMHASMREVTTHFRECWLRGIDALPAVEKAAARLRESQQIEHILHGLVQIYEHDARISADLPDGFDAESVCRFVIENVMGGLHHRNGNCDVLFGLLERTLYANRTQ